MANTRPWTVTPHGPLNQLEDNLWTVDSRVPGTPMTRRMTVVRRSDGTLVFYQAVPVDDATLAQIQALGKPAVLIVPHDQHGMDAPAFAQKLDVKMYGPRKTAAKMKSKFGVAGDVEDLPADASLTLEPVAGAKTGEPVAIIRSGNGHTSAVFADAYMATPSEGTNLMLRMLGFAGGPKVSPIFKMMFMDDRAGLKAHLNRIAGMPGLTHLIPCHGLIESKDASGVLRKVAAAL